MHHVALDRPWPDDRHLNDDVVERARLQPRQHRHLRSRFDLKRPQRVGFADHRVGGGVLGRDGCQIQHLAFMFRQQIERAPHTAQHAKTEHIDLHEAEGVDVVLVPLDYLAVDHGGRLDGHQIVQPFLGQHEAAWMLRHMPRKPDQCARQIHRQAQPAVFQIEVQRRGVFLGNALLAPAPDLGRERAGHILGQTQRLADIAYCAAAAIADDRGAERGTMAAIGVGRSTGSLPRAARARNPRRYRAVPGVRH